MRKIFCWTESLLEMYRRDFLRDTDKFFRASKVEVKHLEETFEHKGNKWQLVGQIDDKEMVCKNLDTETYWAIDRITVQRCLIGETNFIFKKTATKP
jgi:hypothetical protein